MLSSKTVLITRVVIMAHGHLKVFYLGPVFAHKIVITKYYHGNAGNFLKRFFRFFKAIKAINGGWFPRIANIYNKGAIKKDTAMIDVGKEDVYLPEFYSYENVIIFKIC